jgi:pimeloyl-ACP methyl ester carboxylesterase
MGRLHRLYCRAILLATIAGAGLFWATRTWAQSPAAPPPAEGPPPAAPPAQAPDFADVGLLTNWRSKTFGGVQLWGDELMFYDWRIQRHALMDHCRLLDGNDKRHYWGSFEACLAELERIKRDRKIPPMSGRVVILLHGLGGWRVTMTPMADYIQKLAVKEHGSFLALKVSYPSTRASIGAHAKALASIVEHLDGVSEIDFVAHSLGNLVIRHYLGDTTDKLSGRMPDPRIKRIVMLAPPNQGAQRAKDWSDSDLFAMILGDSALEVGAGWANIERKLATPACEFGIIAGGRGDGRGFTALEGDDDGILSVSSTRLVGARDFMVVPVVHPLTVLHPRVQECTWRFLEYGYFVAEDQRQPIVSEK